MFQTNSKTLIGILVVVILIVGGLIYMKHTSTPVVDTPVTNSDSPLNVPVVSDTVVPATETPASAPVAEAPAATPAQ